MDNQTRKLKRIDLVFENCEVAMIPIDEIGFVYFGGVSKTFYHSKNSSGQGLMASEFTLHIDKEVSDNLKTNIFGITDMYLTERLKLANDITYVDVIYEDGGHDYICVWNDDEHDYNRKQETHIGHSEVILSIK